MRTSGTGNDALMTTVPILILVVFATVMAGGPVDLLRVLEGYVRDVVVWMAKMVS
jgi:hypothetical protein